MKILVTSGTGTIGTRVIKLLRSNSEVQALQGTRKPKTSDQIFFDFSDRATWEGALSQIDKVILITPASPTEMADGLKFIEVAQQSRLKHLVFMSIHQVDMAPQVPHFASKIAIQKALEKSGLLWTTIAPNNFYQNDLWFKESLLNDGIYPQPYGHVGLSRVDADDIAEALSRAALQEELAGQIFPLVGPEVLTVQDVCNVYAKHLNREIRYGGDNLDHWEAFNKQFLPEWLVQDWRQMYDFFQKKGLRASAKDFLQQERILGHPPKNFEQFVIQTVQKWK